MSMRRLAGRRTLCHAVSLSYCSSPESDDADRCCDCTQGIFFMENASRSGINTAGRQ